MNVITGNLLDAKETYICHQVNCQGKMNSGVAKAIREKYPEVFSSYLFKCSEAESADKLLGSTQMVKTKDNHFVINMFSQFNYGYDGRRYTSYDAFWNALNLIKNSVSENSTIAFPFGIGCGRGGANWNIIYAMIKEVFNDSDNIVFYKMEEK
jgi:O-acetyl-ADP-ribose deacetylase (regulator of RNase III)